MIDSQLGEDFAIRLSIRLVLSVFVNIENPSILFGPAPPDSASHRKGYKDGIIRRNTEIIEWLEDIIPWAEDPNNVFLDTFGDETGVPPDQTVKRITVLARARIKDIKKGGLDKNPVYISKWKVANRPSKYNKRELATGGKIVAKDVLKIREMWATGNYDQLDIAIKYKVTKSCIHNIVRRKSWKEI